MAHKFTVQYSAKGRVIIEQYDDENVHLPIVGDRVSIDGTEFAVNGRNWIMNSESVEVVLRIMLRKITR